MSDSDALQKKLESIELYRDVDIIYKELQELGYGNNDKLDVAVLCKLDQLHYHGTEAVDDVIKSLGVGPHHNVLDVGSGLGGPARYLANSTKCHVTAMEIQEPFHKAASDLTNRSGLDSHIIHLCDDFLTADLGEKAYDFLFAWLVFMHIEDKKNLFQSCYNTLKPGAKLYMEDFWVKRPWTAEEDALIQAHIYCPKLQTWDDCKDQLSRAGFTDIQMTDMTNDWTNYTHARLDAYKQKRDRHVHVQGEETTRAIQTFYTVVSDSFAAGLVGGVQIVATKP